MSTRSVIPRGHTGDAHALSRTMPKGWSIALCEPEVPDVAGCQPTVIARMSRTDRPSLYRGACFGCGWIGGVCDDSNTAVEDAHDHTHPGWRDLPAFDTLPYADDTTTAKRRARLARETAHLYPEGWADRCGPSITWRTPPCTRHVPGRGLFGGYDMARTMTGDIPHRPRTVEPVQGALF